MRPRSMPGRVRQRDHLVQPELHRQRRVDGVDRVDERGSAGSGTTSPSRRCTAGSGRRRTVMHSGAYAASSSECPCCSASASVNGLIVEPELRWIAVGEDQPLLLVAACRSSARSRGCRRCAGRPRRCAASGSPLRRQQLAQRLVRGLLQVDVERRRHPHAAGVEHLAVVVGAERLLQPSLHHVAELRRDRRRVRLRLRDDLRQRVAVRRGRLLRRDQVVGDHPVEHVELAHARLLRVVHGVPHRRRRRHAGERRRAGERERRVCAARSPGRSRAAVTGTPK